MSQKFIKKLLDNVAVRVLVWIWSNIIQTVSSKTRTFIEKNFFNPYDFWEHNIKYTLDFTKKILDIIHTYKFDLHWKKALELWPWWFLWVWSHLKKYWINKYYALDVVNHFENVDSWIIQLYNKIDTSLIKDWRLNKDFFGILLYKNWKIPLDDNSVDITFSNYVYEHVDEPYRSIKEIARITKSWWIWIHEIWYLDHIFNWDSLFYRIIPERLYTFLFKKSWWWVNRKTHYFFRNTFKKFWFEILDEAIISQYTDKMIKKYKKLLGKYHYDDLKVSKALFIMRKQ